MIQKYYPSHEPKTGRFMRLKPGEKPNKMLLGEKELNVKFENDYKNLYLSGELGQKRFSRRWGVSNRGLIFGQNLRDGRRSWSQMLNLPLITGTVAMNIPKGFSLPACEVCGITGLSLDNAHWVESVRSGSTKSTNILKLCPNCHRKLDRNDPVTTELARSTLLIRVVKKILEQKGDNNILRKELLMQVEPIILHRRN